MIRMSDLEFFTGNKKQFARGQLLAFLLNEKHRLVVARLRSPKRLAENHSRPRPLSLLCIVGHQHHSATAEAQKRSQYSFCHSLKFFV